MLAWCETATVQEENTVQNTEEQTKEEVVVEEKNDEKVLYMWDDEAWFVMDTESGPIYLIPWMATEETTLKSNNQFQEDAVAGDFSKFLVVWFVLDNESKDSITFFSSDIPEVYDSKDRRYKPASEYTSDFYLPTAIAVLESKPWIPTQWYVVYEVAKDSEWFYMKSQNWKILLQERE